MNSWKEEEVSILKIKELLEKNYEIEVDSPDGWVGVNYFVDKGMWKEFVLEFENDWNHRPVRCNENHLFETTFGWKKATDIVNKLLYFLTRDGWKKGRVIETDNMIPIVDINVNHSNHRYYTNGVSSHNSGVGKSLFKCHHAASCLAQGKNVLYLSLEMAEERIAERIDANLLNIAVDDLAKLSKEDYIRKFSKLRDSKSGKLIIKEYPTASAGANHFRLLLNELNLKKNFVPDIIFVDYLNICSSSRLRMGSTINSYTYVKSIAEELRGLAVEFNIPILTSVQLNRSGAASSDPGMEDVSESAGISHTADMMFALISTEELESLNQLMVKQVKNRYADPTKNKRFVIGVDRAKMKLYDVEPSAQTDIVNSGQTPQTNSFTQKRSFDEFKFD